MPKGTYLTIKDISNRQGANESYSQLFFPATLKISTDDNQGSPIWEDVYSLYNLTTDDKEIFKLLFTLYSANQGEEVTRFEEEIEVSPKVKKVLNASIIGDINTSVSGNIKLSLDNTDLEESPKDYSWEIK